MTINAVGSRLGCLAWNAHSGRSSHSGLI